MSKITWKQFFEDNFPNWKSNFLMLFKDTSFIFKNLTITEIPILTDGATLDTLLYYRYLQSRYMNSIAQVFVHKKDGVYELEQGEYGMDGLTSIIVKQFKDKWIKIYQAMIAEYNPIHNYNMTEHEEVNTYVENTRNVDNNVFGFNTSSTDGVPQSKGTQSDIVDGDKTNNYSDHTKSGNIGVTTTQKMLQEELEVRKQRFLDIVMQDIASVICLKIL